MQFVPRRRDHSTTEPRAVATGTYTQQLICSYNAKHLVQNAASIGSGAAARVFRNGVSTTTSSWLASFHQRIGLFVREIANVRRCFARSSNGTAL